MEYVIWFFAIVVIVIGAPLAGIALLVKMNQDDTKGRREIDGHQDEVLDGVFSGGGRVVVYSTAATHLTFAEVVAGADARGYELTNGDQSQLVADLVFTRRAQDSSNLT